MRAGRSACASFARSSTSSRATGTSAAEPPPARRLGILGGTFNPPHLGHLALARDALAELALEGVVLMPANASPHKLAARDPGPAHRLQMCRLLAQDDPGMSVCAAEIERGGPSYTVDTLRSIHAGDPDVELSLIVGADTAATLASWREPRQVLAQAALAVAAREGSERDAVLRELARVADDAPGRVRFLSMPLVPISSSLVRERAARGEPIDPLVGERVARYVREHGLYRSTVGTRD